MFSDGYQDQFSSENGKKIGVKRLTQLLKEMEELPWEEREARLEEYLLTWKGTEMQIDDILVMGFNP